MVIFKRRRIANDIRRFAVRDLPQNSPVSRLIAEMVPYGGFINEARQYSSGRIGSPAFSWLWRIRAGIFAGPAKNRDFPCPAVPAMYAISETSLARRQGHRLNARVARIKCTRCVSPDRKSRQASSCRRKPCRMVSVPSGPSSFASRGRR